MSRLAGLFAAISGLFHLLVPLVSSAVQGIIFPICVGLLWLLIAFGLSRNLRWVAWLAFYVAMADAIAALYLMVSITAGPDWLYAALCVSATFVAVMIFRVLWGAPERHGFAVRSV
ncbi:MAG: hypothetical protein AAFW82_02680 [Pseudomonadota bacterium]